MRYFLRAAAIAAVMALPAMAQDQPVEPGFVYGTVKDMAGKPLAGAVVFIDGVYDNNMVLTTKSDGAYRMRLPPGAYRVTATLEHEFDGQLFKVDLRPNTTDSFSYDDGAVRNFTWALSGRKVKPDMGEFGGFIYVNIGSGEHFVEDTHNITYTLTPSGPLIDGSTGEVIVRKGGRPRTADYGKINDVPIGRYVITGVYAPPGMKPQTLKFRDREISEDWADSLEFGFRAEGNYCTNCASLEVEPLLPPEPQ